MHDNNRRWLSDLRQQYPSYFSSKKVLELGSAGAEDDVRKNFSDCDYTGIDTVASPQTDIVGNVKDVDLGDESFDVIISMSMLEHDPDWKLSLTNVLPHLKSDGILIMCWGAEGNLHHGPDPWALVPAQDVIDFLKDSGFGIEDHFNEESRYGADCAGAYDLIAFPVRITDSIILS